MSFFSFGKKDDASSSHDAYSESPRGSRQNVRTERLTRRSERSDADAMMVDPTLPERQRARRRLVGAVALVAAAVIVLPMVLDSHPKPVADDIAIDIPARPVAPLPKTAQPGGDSSQADSTSAADTQAGVAPDSPPDASSQALAASPSPAPASSVAGSAKSAKIGVPQAQAQTKAAAQDTPPAPKSQQPQPLAATDTSPAATLPPPAKPSTPSSPAGSRFVLQIGTFDEDGPAQTWVSKLKAAGVPAYVEHKKQADGSVRSLLRAGPFADRAAASAALVKVRHAGLGGGNAGSNAGSKAATNGGNNAGSGNTPAN